MYSYTDKELPNFPVDSTYLRTIRQRARLARQINDIEHRRHRAKTREQWLSQSAKALDIELDEDLYPLCNIHGGGGCVCSSLLSLSSGSETTFFCITV